MTAREITLSDAETNFIERMGILSRLTAGYASPGKLKP